ncbi:hypothetical protein PPL_08584 [Heterostelium album PN500]|uniref:Pre-rRNA-processing protein RIX1 N-terminal domain-containing protein n=1 Tax=Heterostelium pallidum (strain ATCC 26659 / Pp 5 / PN500) TaxID=670386 RepID=D3BJ59_HETP5|nr:hypothetical protein PPL_08584 [Heterostelium album PN500]EFA77939.1 hypothetical protein PPL_08584 [Heterostelium album PN500]|eukprot:XP_020430067.1 hypothetical protein PPL_08584 [Heterostelium album PN500]
MKRLADSINFNDREESENKNKKRVTKIKSAAQLQEEIIGKDVQKVVEKKDNTLNVQLLRSIMDSYLSDGANSELITTYIPDIVALLHQQDCLESIIADHSQDKLIQQWVTRVSTMVKVGHGRLTLALYLLLETIRVCDYDLMLQHTDQWIRILTGLSTPSTNNNNNKSSDSTLNSRDYITSIMALSLLVEKASKWNDLRRAIVVNATLQQIFTTITLSLSSQQQTQQSFDNQQSKISSLIALKTLFVSLTSSMRPYLARTESIAYPLLLKPDPKIQECAASLIGSLSLSVSLASSDLYWDVAVQRLIIELHHHVSIFYQGVEENSKQQQQSEDYPKTVVMPASNKIGAGEDAILTQLNHLANVELPKLPNSANNLFHTQQRLQAFNGLINCLISILTSTTQSACSIPIDPIIKLICRILNTGFTQIRSRLEYSDIVYAQLVAVIGHLHQYSYQLISVMSQCFRKALLPYSKTISSLLLRPLRMRESYSNSQIQLQVYQCILDVIESLGSSCTDTSNTSTIDNVDSTHLHNPIANEIRTIALQVASKVLLYCGSCLSILSSSNNNSNNNSNSNNGNILRFELDQTVLSLLLKCQQLQQTKRQSAVYQDSSYSDYKYRAALYSCLSASVLRPIGSLPPVLPYALRLLTIGMNDEHPKVRSKCSKGLAISQSLIHPQVPNLQAPPMTSISLSQLSGGSGSSTTNGHSLSGVNQQDDFMKTFQQIESSNYQQQMNEINNNDDDDEEEEEEEGSKDKLDISLNDLSDEEDDDNKEDQDNVEDDDDEEEEEDDDDDNTTKTKTTTTNLMSNMKTNLFDQSLFNKPVLSTKESSNNTTKSSTTTTLISKKQEDDLEDDEDEDLPDLVDEPPSSEEDDQ